MNDEPSAQDQCEANHHTVPIPPPEVGAMFPDIAAEEGSMFRAAMDIPFEPPAEPPAAPPLDPGREYGILHDGPLPRYKSHKVVNAVEIVEISDSVFPGRTMVYCKTPGSSERRVNVTVGVEWIRRHKPEVGGFVVLYGDGYLSYSPKEPFLAGYTRIYT